MFFMSSVPSSGLVRTPGNASSGCASPSTHHPFSASHVRARERACTRTPTDTQPHPDSQCTCSLKEREGMREREGAGRGRKIDRKGRGQYIRHQCSRHKSGQDCRSRVLPCSQSAHTPSCNTTSAPTAIARPNRQTPRVHQSGQPGFIVFFVWCVCVCVCVCVCTYMYATRIITSQMASTLPPASDLVGVEREVFFGPEDALVGVAAVLA